MKSYRIHLIRHGKTEGNLNKRYVGSTDLPLCPEGIAELNTITERFDYPRAGAYYISPMLRCHQTADLIYPGAEFETVDDLREIDFGDWENQHMDDLVKDPQFQVWMEDGMSAAPPNGEPGAAFTERICKAFEKIVEQMLRAGNTSGVIIAHGGVIMTLLTKYGLPRAKFFDWLAHNGEGYTILINPRIWMTDKLFEVIARIPDLDDPGTSHSAFI